MPILLGAARPDCDYKDPKATLIIRGHIGCPKQSQFKIWIQNTVDGAFKDKPIHACKEHAPFLFKQFLNMAKEMRRLGERVKVFIVDITLAETPKAKPVRVLVKREDKGLNTRRLNRFLARRRH